MACHCDVCGVVSQASWAECTDLLHKKLLAEVTEESHHISDGRVWEKRSTCFCIDYSPLQSQLASDVDGAHKSTDFFCALAVLVMSHDCTGLRLGPGTDHNAPHWSLHPDNALASPASRAGLLERNVKHPGNPRGELVARHTSNERVDQSALKWHLLLLE